jgi:hypothetical protein
MDLCRRDTDRRLRTVDDGLLGHTSRSGRDFRRGCAHRTARPPHHAGSPEIFMPSNANTTKVNASEGRLWFGMRSYGMDWQTHPLSMPAGIGRD